MATRIAAAALLSFLLSAPSYGQAESGDFDVEDLAIEYCTWVSVLARDVMTARQKDKPLSETLPFALERVAEFPAEMAPHILEKAEGDVTEQAQAELFALLEESATQMKPFIRLIVIGAYDIPAYSTEGNRRRAISNFENSAFSSCYAGLDEADLEE